MNLPGLRDVFLNDTTCRRNAPEKVRDCTIGGHQVVKKYCQRIRSAAYSWPG